jgi:hypothetical protein
MTKIQRTTEQKTEAEARILNARNATTNWKAAVAKSRAAVDDIRKNLPADHTFLSSVEFREMEQELEYMERIVEKSKG